MHSKFLKVILSLVILTAIGYGAFRIFTSYQVKKVKKHMEVSLQKYPNHIKTSEITLQCQNFLLSQNTHPANLDAYPDIIALGNLESCSCMVDALWRAGVLDEVKGSMKNGMAFNLAIRSTSPSAQKLIEDTCQ